MNAKVHDPKNALGIRYLLSDAGKLKGIQRAKFDLVFANMSLMDIKDAAAAVKESGRILKRGGRFVASICHPCFDIMSNSAWVVEKSFYLKKPLVYRKVRGYREPFSEEVPWNLGGGKRKYTRGFHRPLNWYVRAVRSGGMAVTGLEEPVPTKEFVEEEQKKPGDLDGLGFLEVPLHLVIEAVKL